MSFVLTFLGKGGVGRTTVAIAAAKQFAAQGQRVLFVSPEPGPGIGLQLGTPLGPDPQEIAPKLQAVQLQAAVLLERSWEEVKKLETQYVRTPFFREVFGEELGVLPGMDSALVMNAIREYDASGKYDVIVFDGSGDQNILRTLGMPEILSWYIRRFSKVFSDSDLGKTVAPFVQPLASAVLNVNWTSNNFAQPREQVESLLEQGKAAAADPNRVAAYLVTTAAPGAIATARYLWGSAQQIGLTVGGVLLNQAQVTEAIRNEFLPLKISAIPQQSGDDWQPLIEALPDFNQVTQAPKPITIDLPARKVSLFLPSFDRNQVKLTQYGPEVTVEAGDQRRNLFLPPELRGKQVTGAKFQDGYLIISF